MHHALSSAILHGRGDVATRFILPPSTDAYAGRLCKQGQDYETDRRRRLPMKKFLVLYLAPVSVLDDWSKTDPDKRKIAEDKMRGDWRKWTSDHAKMILDTEAGGKTKRVSSTGTSDARNDIMLYSFVEAESHEAAAKPFESHPHLQIPQASIEIMEVRAMTGM
jgi:hypothetical protein